MIKKKDEMKRRVRENLRGGNGGIGFTDAFSQEEMLDKCSLCAVLDLEPGMSIGLHAHGPDAEIYFMLEGELTAVDNGIKKTIRPGDAVFTGGGTSHSVSNDSDKTAKMLAVVVR
ncbi:MAG: cupin domain-containing protein [Bacillota bacterium]|nr:cupin domain-containing protein [Bacillota bacterium]